MSLKNASGRIVRGCGERQDQALYATVPMGAFGQPIESFLVDPVITFGNKPLTLRAPRFVTDPSGTYHVILGVGKQYYPTVPDFVEEARIMGVSKRLPRDFDPAKLTPGKSKLLLYHPKAIPNFPFKGPLVCPTRKLKEHLETSSQCIGDLWPLAALETGPEARHKLILWKAGKVWIETPSVQYQVAAPELKRKKGRTLAYLGGIFLSFPGFDFEYVSKSGEIPAGVVERISRAKYKLRVVPK